MLKSLNEDFTKAVNAATGKKGDYNNIESNSGRLSFPSGGPPKQNKSQDTANTDEETLSTAEELTPLLNHPKSQDMLMGFIGKVQKYINDVQMTRQRYGPLDIKNGPRTKPSTKYGSFVLTSATAEQSHKKQVE